MKEYFDHGLDFGITPLELIPDEDEIRQPESHVFEFVGKPMYALVLKDQRQLKNGFRYIKELLLQHHNNKLEVAYDTLRINNISVYSIKTDCFTIKAKDLPKAKELLNFDNGIGSWRLSKTEDIIFPTDKINVKRVELFEFSHLQTTPLIVNDEWDTNEFCNLFETHKRVMVRAEYAGCGKSYACKVMEQRGHKVLFACPTNKLAQNNRENGVTLHQFFGVGMVDVKNQRINKFDDSAYNVIVFDEIYFTDIRMLARIKNYCERNPDKIIIATGDTSQLESVDQITNNLDIDKYLDHCINTIFPNNIHLMINKRLKSDEDKKILANFKTDIFNPSKPVMATIRKYFKFTNSIDTANNIAYKNTTCADVAKVVRDNMGKTEDYEIGEKLVCRKYLKLGTGKVMNVNFEYTITGATKDTVTLLDESKKNLTLFPITKLIVILF